MPSVVLVAALSLLGAVGGALLRIPLAAGRHRRGEEVGRPRRGHWWVVVVMTLSWGATGLARADVAVSVTLLATFTWLVALVAIDLDVRRLPDRLTLPAVPVGLVLLAGCSLESSSSSAWSRLLVAVACGAASCAVYLVLVLVQPDGLGLGDVKLALPLGMLTGWWSVGAAVGAFLVTFLIALVWGVLAALTSGQGRKTTFALGPSMALSAGVILLAYASG